MIWLCITSERHDKTARIMGALANGFRREARIIEGPPPDDGNPFVVWGQLWLARDVIPRAYAERRPFWQLDNGFYKSARGGVVGYYRLTYRGLSAIMLERPGAPRIPIRMQPWRQDGKHIVFAYPGQNYGSSIGLNMPVWTRDTALVLDAISKRPIIRRPKECGRPLAQDLRNAWALVTHSSNVAVDAVISGIPVFVAASSPAAPVGRTDFVLDEPVMPNRDPWWASLMAQQFTMQEMADGTAVRFMRMIQEQVDGR